MGKRFVYARGKRRYVFMGRQRLYVFVEKVHLPTPTPNSYGGACPPGHIELSTIKHLFIMANINLSQNTYVDYVASLYFNACGVKDVEFTPKVVKVSDKDVVLVHVSGVQTTTGIKVNVDLWPRDEATAEDVEKLSKASLSDIEFRIGYWPTVNENGETELRQGTPKWIAYSVGGRMLKLSGEKREFGE